MKNRLRWLAGVYARALVDVVATAVFVLVLWGEGAPSWALWLALFVGTRCSRLDVAMDLGALQTSIRRTISETMPQEQGPTRQQRSKLPPF